MTAYYLFKDQNTIPKK